MAQQREHGRKYHGLDVLQRLTFFPNLGGVLLSAHIFFLYLVVVIYPHAGWLGKLFNDKAAAIPRMGKIFIVHLSSYLKALHLKLSQSFYSRSLEQ